jgi:hypothetical protein
MTMLLLFEAKKWQSWTSIGDMSNIFTRVRDHVYLHQELEKVMSAIFLQNVHGYLFNSKLLLQLLNHQSLLHNGSFVRIIRRTRRTERILLLPS